jgi:glycosyltransferase EpsD
MSWLTYYPAEVLLSSWADGIVTINREDFDRISRVGSKKTLYFQIPGIGVERRRFVPVDKEEKNRIRLRNGFQPDDFLLVFAAEFIHRKNHEFLVEAMAQLKTTSPEVKVLFCGRGELQDDIEQIAIRKGVKDAQVFFMGFRSDIHEMYQMADLGVSSSRQEGLGLNLIEEMMCGLPVLASFDRGHQEIVQDGVNGYLFQQNNFSDFKEKLHLLRDKNAYPNFSRQSMNSVQKFELSNSLKAMENIYHRIVSVK